MIPLFDSLSHPTLNGKWLQSSFDASFERLDSSLKASNFFGAAATGINGIEDYDHGRYMEQCKLYPCLVPIAGFHPQDEKQIRNEMAKISKLGFSGIKIHPRFSRIKSLEKTLSEIFKAASETGLPVYYCTYLHSEISQYPTTDPFYSLIRALKAAPKVKVVLVHGGDVQILRYAELVRFNPNLLLDLSLTICKYAGSSLDQDIRFLFQSFDRRICIGSDHPEWSHSFLRERFEHFSEGLSKEKKENIGYRNILHFLTRPDVLAEGRRSGTVV